MFRIVRKCILRRVLAVSHEVTLFLWYMVDSDSKIGFAYSNFLVGPVCNAYA